MRIWGKQKDKIREENRITANWLIHYRARKRDHENHRQELVVNTKEKAEKVGGGIGFGLAKTSFNKTVKF